MIEIFVFVILVAMFFVDHRLSKLVKIQRELLNQQREVTKALQWMVNNWRKADSEKVATQEAAGIAETPPSLS